MTHPRWNKEDRCFVFIFREGGERDKKEIFKFGQEMSSSFYD